MIHKLFQIEGAPMQIHGFNKTTLLDYPGHLAATIFVGGCNFRCPFCHNASLVINPSNENTISIEDIYSTLNKRKGILEGICITGGEPTIYPGLKDFIRSLKDMGFLVKLDTNGNNPKVLKDLVDNHFVDYVAMDIKNSKEKYSLSVGLPYFQTTFIEESAHYLLNGTIPYEFRTTIVKEHHNHNDILAIGKWLNGAHAYYLQAYKDSGDIISPGLTSYPKSELNKFRDALLPYAKKVEVRGID